MSFHSGQVGCPKHRLEFLFDVCPIISQCRQVLSKQIQFNLYTSLCKKCLTQVHVPKESKFMVSMQTSSHASELYHLCNQPKSNHLSNCMKYSLHQASILFNLLTLLTPHDQDSTPYQQVLILDPINVLFHQQNMQQINPHFQGSIYHHKSRPHALLYSSYREDTCPLSPLSIF